MLKRILKKILSKSFNNPLLIEFFAASIGNQNLVKLLKYHKVTKVFDVGLIRVSMRKPYSTLDIPEMLRSW